MASRRLRITSCEVGYQGTGANDKPYTIYDIEAVDPDTGIAVNQTLRSFSRLEVGEVGEFGIDKYEKNGRVSYTLSKPGSGGRGGGGGGKGLGQSVDELRSRLDMQEEALRTANARLDSLQSVVDGLVRNGVGDPAPVGGGSTAPPPDDDDIPF